MLVWSLVENGGVSPECILLHLSPGVDPSSMPVAKHLGVNFVTVARYPELPYCNKVSQVMFGTLEASTEVVLLDCDTAILRPIGRIKGEVAGKPAEGGPVGSSVLRRMFRDAEVSVTLARTDFSRELSPATWFNGGFYFFKTEVLSQLAIEWPRWVEWLRNYEPVASFGQHFDEWAFALAVANCQYDVRRLSRSYNFPVHLATPIWKGAVPKVIHYHNHFAKNGQLRAVPTKPSFGLRGVPLANYAIRRFNRGLSRFYSLRAYVGGGQG